MIRLLDNLTVVEWVILCLSFLLAVLAWRLLYLSQKIPGYGNNLPINAGTRIVLQNSGDISPIDAGPLEHRLDAALSAINNEADRKIGLQKFYEVIGKSKRQQQHALFTLTSLQPPLIRIQGGMSSEEVKLTDAGLTFVESGGFQQQRSIRSDADLRLSLSADQQRSAALSDSYNGQYAPGAKQFGKAARWLFLLSLAGIVWVIVQTVLRLPGNA